MRIYDVAKMLEAEKPEASNRVPSYSFSASSILATSKATNPAEGSKMICSVLGTLCWMVLSLKHNR
jgi:hypothetical protein